MGILTALRTLPLEVFRHRNFVAHFNGLLSKFMQKNVKFEYANPILGKLVVTHDLG